MPSKKPALQRRSGCPLNASVEMLGDRWSLLIIRDMLLLGSRTFKDLLNSYERPATNILTDRLRRLAAYGIITPQKDPTDGRKLFICLHRRASISRRFLPKWCFGLPPLKRRKSKLSSVK